MKKHPTPPRVASLPGPRRPLFAARPQPSARALEAQPAAAPLRLGVAGSTLLDEHGKPLVLQGVNMYLQW